MTSVILGCLFAALTLLAVSLMKTYQHIPIKELKRRAREGDELARALHKAASYEYSLETVLWLCICFFSAGFFIIAAREWPAWFALLASATLVWLGFFWLPTGRVTSLGNFAAKRIAPALAWVLNYLHPTIDKVVAFVQRHRPVRFHTGVYDKDDLLSLLEYQQGQPDNRIDPTELEITRNALTLGDITIHDIVIPRRVVRSVAADDSVGPILLSELHKSGFSRFPVQEGDTIVGILYLRDITGSKVSGKVSDAMRQSDFCFIHEDQALPEALQVILGTHSQLLIVVNSFEEYVGIVTIEDILEQIVGKPIIDEFDMYDDLRAVAAKQAAKEHKAHEQPEQPSQD